MSSAPILKRALLYGAIVAVAVAIVAGVLGQVFAGTPGLLGGLVGAGVTAVFLGLTAASMLIAGRVVRGDVTNPLFFGIVAGAWLLKLVLFIVAAILVQGAPWMDPYVFFGAVIASVIGSLIGDVVAFARARVPYVSEVVLPEDAAPKP